MLRGTGQILSGRALVNTRELLSNGRYFNPGNAPAALPQSSGKCRSAWMTAQEIDVLNLAAQFAPSIEMLLCVRPGHASHPLARE